MFYGYVRVSTEEQNLENQKKAISEKYKIRKWIEEKRSGTVDFHKRNLGKLIEQLNEGDTLVVKSILYKSIQNHTNFIKILYEILLEK